MAPADALVASSQQVSAAIYDRVSVLRKGETRSMEDQKAANLAACDTHGWTVTGVYADPDISASRFAGGKKRPDWEELAAALEAGRYGVLVLWEPSRGGRELEMWARLLNVCRTNGILIHITSHARTYDVSRPREWRTLAEDGVDSAYESEKTSERIKRGVGSAASEGRPHSTTRYGFKRIYSPETGRLIRQEIDPGAAQVLRELARAVLYGDGLYHLAKGLNQRGVTAPRGGGWTSSQIRAMLIHPSYAGFRTHRGEKIKSPWFPEIFDERTHHQLVAILTDPSRSGDRDPRVKHLLSGIATCGVCRRKVRMNYKAGVASYRCFERIPDGTAAGHVSRRETIVDEYVESVMVQILSRPDRLAAMIRDASASSDDLGEIMDEITELRARLEAFYDEAADGNLTPTGLSRVEGPILKRIAAAEGRAQSLRTVLPDLDLDTSGGIEQAARSWQDRGLHGQRELLRRLFVSIQLRPVGVGFKGPADARSVEMTPRYGTLAALIEPR